MALGRFGSEGIGGNMVLGRDGNVGIIVSKCKGGAAAAAVLVHVSERW